MPTLARRLGRTVLAHADVTAGLLLVGLGVGDLVTGVDIAFTLLYLAPIGLVAWTRGRLAGALTATAAIALATTAELLGRAYANESPDVPRFVWNHGASFVIFLVAASLLARLRVLADRDAAARRATIEQLRQAERLGVVGRLAAGLAHELGTPLNVVLGHAEALLEPTPSPLDRRTSAEAIVRQTTRMTTIIRNLLDFSRRAGDSARERVDLARVARDAATLLGPVARRVNVSIELEAAESVEVSGNRTEIEQVLVNVMMNGIQAMEETGRPGRLALRVVEGAVEVEDDGPGIAEADLPHIFDPFFTTKEVGRGTGLGLAVAWGIVSDHGGAIRAEPSTGGGTRVRIELPAAPG